MRIFTVRIPGYRLTVSAINTWDAIDQVRDMFPFSRCGSARTA